MPREKAVELPELREQLLGHLRLWEELGHFERCEPFVSGRGESVPAREIKRWEAEGSARRCLQQVLESWDKGRSLLRKGLTHSVHEDQMVCHDRLVLSLSPGP